MPPHRLRRSIKLDKRLVIDIIFAALSLTLTVGVSMLTIHRHPTARMLAAAPIAHHGSIAR